MSESLDHAREHFIQGMSRIAHFWGFPKAMGAIFGAVYLAAEPVGLDDLVRAVGVSKGAVSTNIRGLERMGLVKRHLQLGDRKDYYVPETDLWRAVRTILNERERPEFDRALGSVSESLGMVRAVKGEHPAEAALQAEAALLAERMDEMRRFFATLDKMVAALIALDRLKLSALPSLFGK
ncbi:MAG: GbsR/MarR family transcriptional regulator [Desulfovibrionaceae bacterium]